LVVDNLEVDYVTDDGIVRAVDNISFRIPPGLRMGFVGESGSGKTTTALALMGLIQAPGRVSGGRALLGNTDLLALSPQEQVRHRLASVSYIPQGAMNSLNPVSRIRDQMIDGLLDHGIRMTNRERDSRVEELLSQVGLQASVARKFPHELSGGMKQRVCIAIAISMGPKILIADEPTSALDVITQRLVMQTLRNVQEKVGAGLILIGHDMGLMAQFVDELMVLRKGKLVEQGDVRQIFKSPKHEYTRALIDSVPTGAGRSHGVAATVATAPSPFEPPSMASSSRPALLELRGAGKNFPSGLFGRGGTRALFPLSMRLDGDEPRVISVVGQSGSGKSTLAGLLLGFLSPSEGEVMFEGKLVSGKGASRPADYYRKLQAVFQDPYAAYNPFYKIDHALAEPLVNFGLARGRAEILANMQRACEVVGLDPDQTIHRFAHQLSGGQRQRLMVGRAVMLKPKLLVADEPVSMVDASLRSTILASLRDLKDSHGVSIVYITHDLATAYEISDYVIVLNKGRVVEAGTPEVVIRSPMHPYTRELVASIPWPDPDRTWGEGEHTDTSYGIAAGFDDNTTILRDTISGFQLRV
jgi:peptide/nickel transport system ATP-binding protein